MNVILVCVVGVEWLVICVLIFDGVVNLLVLLVVELVGVDEIYCIGGV